MKKRLFITTALMTAVLGCTLTTGTYAWYVATAGSFTTASGDGTLNTAKNEYSVGDITFTISLTTSDKPDLVNAAGETWYFTKGTSGQAGSGKTQNTNNKKFGTMTLQVTSTADANKLLSIAGDYHVTIATTAGTTGASSKVKYSETSTSPYGNDGKTSIEIGLTITSEGAIQFSNSTNTTTFYYSIIADETNVEEEYELTVTGTMTAGAAK